ncbi:hypothetical protein Ddc_16188 [Ditylenchus destructor]|nr:hypothetical protein Ddc_16188 [Ditylenchus destructor]
MRLNLILAGYGAFGAVVWESISAAYCGFVSANSRPSAARTLALSVPRGAPRRSDPQTTNTLHTYLPSS